MSAEKCRILELRGSGGEIFPKENRAEVHSLQAKDGESLKDAAADAAAKLSPCAVIARGQDTGSAAAAALNADIEASEDAAYFAFVREGTGWVCGAGTSAAQALRGALERSGVRVRGGGGVLFTVSDAHKPSLYPVADAFRRLGFEIFATGGTARVLKERGVLTISVKKLSEGSDQIVKLLQAGRLSYVFNTPTSGNSTLRDGHMIRTTAAENGLPCFTDITQAQLLLLALGG